MRLDGRGLFTIAVPAVRDRPNGTPIDTRVQNIETNLTQLAERNLDPNPPQVTAEIDAASNLPIISVNDRYVMTVTLLDAQLQGQEPSSYAKELTQIIRTALILSTYLVIRLSNVAIDRFFSAVSNSSDSIQASQRIALRVSTFAGVARGLSAVVYICIAAIAILSVTGIDIVPLLTGAGIVGLGISLASQNLIKDVINGFSILLEDQYAVGDVIQVGKATGLVENINLRITQLRNAEGRLITIPNSSIAIVENLSKDWSRVDLGLVIAYDALDRAIQLIEQVGGEIDRDPDWQTKTIEPIHARLSG